MVNRGWDLVVRKRKYQTRKGAEGEQAGDEPEIRSCKKVSKKTCCWDGAGSGDPKSQRGVGEGGSLAEGRLRMDRG